MKPIEQPLKGLIQSVLVLVSSMVWIYVGENVLHLSLFMVVVYSLWFILIVFFTMMAGRYGISKMRQPYSGIVYLLVCLVLGILIVPTMGWLGYSDPTLHWPLISNIFLALGVVFAFDNMFVAGLKQPASVILNAIFMWVFTIVLFLWIGFVPAIWFVFFAYCFFWLEQWPIATVKQPGKGVLLFSIMGLMAMTLWWLFIQLGTHFYNPDAGLFFALFIFFIVLTAWEFETWPIKKVKQPAKGIAGLIMSVTLALITWYVVAEVLKINLPDALNYAWVFVVWVYAWDILFGKWPAERPMKKEAKEVVNQEG